MKSIFKKLVHSEQTPENNCDIDMEYFHNEKDPKDNLETTPPSDEKIRIPCIWAFEVFPPEYIGNFYESIDRLGWLDEKIDSLDDFQDTLLEMRHRVGSSGWLNLGVIVDKSDKRHWINPRKANLPKGVSYIRASIFQAIPSTTMLICQFNFEDDLANILEESLQKPYKTYTKKHKRGYRIIGVEHQKKSAVDLNKEYLNSICATWLKENFAGLYASDAIRDEHPVCMFLTLEKNTPFVNNQSLHNYMAILDISQQWDVWISDKLEGLYLQFTKDKNAIRRSLLLTGNIHHILQNEDIEHYGETKEARVVNYFQYLDDTLGTWVLGELLDSYIYKITDLRDLYGKMDMNNLHQSIKTITNLDHEVLKSQKNIIPFMIELKNYCNNTSSFIHNIYEFKQREQGRFTRGNLFSSIRESMIQRIDLLIENEKILKETANATRQISTTISSDNVAETNMRLQKSMRTMTIVMLILTVISTCATIISIREMEPIKSMITQITTLYHNIQK